MPMRVSFAGYLGIYVVFAIESPHPNQHMQDDKSMQQPTLL